MRGVMGDSVTRGRLQPGVQMELWSWRVPGRALTSSGLSGGTKDHMRPLPSSRLGDSYWEGVLWVCVPSRGFLWGRCPGGVCSWGSVRGQGVLWGGCLGGVSLGGASWGVVLGERVLGGARGVSPGGVLSSTRGM